MRVGTITNESVIEFKNQHAEVVFVVWKIKPLFALPVTHVRVLVQVVVSCSIEQCCWDESRRGSMQMVSCPTDMGSLAPCLSLVQM